MENNLTDIIENNTTDTGERFRGMPGLVFLPSHMYNLKIVTEDCCLSIPISGRFSEEYPDFVDNIRESKDADKFSLVFDDDGTKRISSINIVEVLFAASKYPALKDNQIFAVANISLNEDINVLHITGTVLEFVI